MKNLFTKKLCALLVIALFIGNQTKAQSSGKKPLTDIVESEISLKGERYTFPKVYRTLRLDKTEMQQLLTRAPLESDQNGRTSNLIFDMPMPGGTTSQFRIFETFVMHPDLAAKFPEIKTYGGQGIDDPDATIKLDMTPLGFHAMVLSPKGNVFIDPYSAGTTEDYICYYKKDLIASSGFVCETDHVAGNLRSIIGASSGEKSSGTQLRTYRLALACTGEYAATKGGTVSGAMAGMTTSMNRVNGVYETEVAIRMVMVANNNLIVYTNSSTDPYTNGNGSTMLGQNQTTCNNVIGSANYDIGHVFSTGGGGVAYLGCVCSSSNKAGGVTGNSNPVGDGFDIDYVAHEMGHQFGGSHTFNSSTGSCSGNRTASAAYECGSGITIMAYAGICGSDDLAPHSIAYFHTYSFDQIVNYSTTGNGNTCAVTTGTGNTAPVVTSVGSAKSIPISTPFVLTGAATDANGDPLTYSWEEFDLGPAGAWNVQSTTAPMFRPFEPVSSPSRTFPKLSDVISNTTTIGELLPNQARTLKFRLTVRDNRTGGGGVMHPDTTLNISVVNNGGAFAVTAPNTAVTWAGGSTQNVTWNVSGTTASPISCANVKISLSTDGGNTFPTVITSSTANDGTESITVPNTATTQARIKVEAVGNIFFDMSNVNFTITASSGLTTITTSAISPVNYCAGTNVNVSFTTNAAANAGNVFTAQLSNSGGSFASPTSIGTLTSTAAGTIAATIPAGTSAGSGYRIRVVSSSPVVTGSDNGSNITVNPLPTVTANNVSGCAGTSIALSGTPAGGTWSVANPYTGSSTTYTHTYTDGNGCTNTSAAANITVNPLPTVTANNVSGCTETAIALSGTPSGGTWSVPNPYTGPSTTYTHTYTDGNGCTNTSSSASITVNPLPTVTANDVSGCAGTSIALSGTPAGGTWSVANPYTGSSTTYTHTYTDGNGCTNTSVASNITVNPLPTVTADNVSGCAETAIALSGIPAGGTWSVVNPYTGSSTTYTHTYTDGNGCTNTSTAASITVNPLPSVSFSGLASSYNVSASPATLTGSPAGGTFSGPGISGNVFSPSSAGVGGPYTIIYSYADGNACSNSSSQQTTVTNCSVPAMPGSIITIGGAVKVCPGDSKSYKITAVVGATSYTWTPPAGGVISVGQGTVQITVNYTSGFTVSGTLTVVANNSCGSSTPRTLAITRNNPATPGVITGLAAGVCNGTGVPYSVVNVAGITYNWTFNVSTATIATGQGTNAITTDFGSTYTTGFLSVTANNACGTSAVRSLSVKSVPATPASITGATSVCANQFGVSYSISPIASATSYTWTGMPGSHISDGVVTSAGNVLTTTATSVTVNFGSTSGKLNVRANNDCGAGVNKSLTIAFTCRDINDENSEQGLNVFIHPNPVHGQTNISFYSKESSEYSIQLIDLLGKVIFQANGISTGENNYHLTTDKIVKGMYFLRIRSAEKENISRVTVN